jgi:hypothetical protein
MNLSPAEMRELRPRVLKALQKWIKMDEAACTLGRGLGRRELLKRVALDTGSSERQVQSALRGAKGPRQLLP